MTLRLHPIVPYLALLGASVVVAVGATELVLRLAPGQLWEAARLRLSWQGQKLSHAARTRPDSVIGFLYVPDGHDQAVGGSWTFGFGVDSVAWPRLLGDSLRPLEGRNLRLIGSGPEMPRATG